MRISGKVEVMKKRGSVKAGMAERQELESLAEGDPAKHMISCYQEKFLTNWDNGGKKVHLKERVKNRGLVEKKSKRYLLDLITKMYLVISAKTILAVV